MEHHANIVPWHIVGQQLGVELRWLDVDDEGQLVLDDLEQNLDGVKFVGVTAMSNVLATLNPVRRITDAAHAAGAVCVVDNTTAGPLLQRPLDLGATYALTSATKQMSGHADLILGYVTTRDAERAQALRDWRRTAGAIPGPFEVWLAHRSLPTLAIRLERTCDNALAIARLLAARDDVATVRYPGLPGDPGHEVARRQMSGYGMVVSFDVGSDERAEAFLAAAELVTDSTSFGSVHTMAERRARWGGDAVPEGFIRLSAGCEDTADLLADVERALDAAT
jgi:cystathionine gamma-lyase